MYLLAWLMILLLLYSKKMANPSKIGCGSLNHIRFLFTMKMLPICPLSVEPMNFHFSHDKNVAYLSPKNHNTLIYNDLAHQKMLPICPQNVAYLSPALEKCCLSVPKCCLFVPKCCLFVPDPSPKKRFLAKCCLSVPSTRKMLPICPQNVAYLSPKCCLFVPKMLPICPQNINLCI